MYLGRLLALRDMMQEEVLGRVASIDSTAMKLVSNCLEIKKDTILLDRDISLGTLSGYLYYDIVNSNVA